MARAKNTQRAAARRRYRQEVRPNTLADDAYLDDDDPSEDRAAAAAAPAPAPAATGIRGMFTRPDFRGDLQTFPQMMLSEKRLWIPFALLAAGFLLDIGYFWGLLDAGLQDIAVLAFTLILSPQALFVPFIGGFLAPRGAYLVGALIGLFDAILVAILFNGPIPLDRSNGGVLASASIGDVIAIFVVAILFSTFAAAFASWYRRFLRNSQERAKANRTLREQQLAVKRKDDERKARTAERDSRRAATTKKSAP